MSKLSLQEQFNREHEEPLPYGEDGDMYGVSTEYTPEQAGKLFERQWLEQTGDRFDGHYSIGVQGFKQVADGWAATEVNPDVQGILIWF